MTMKTTALAAATVLILVLGALALEAPRPSASSTATTQPVAMSQPENPRSIRVMVANIRLADADNGPNSWPRRRDLLVQTVLKYHPDIVGFQEVTPAQGAYLDAHLPGYAHYPDGTSGGWLTQLTGLLSSFNRTFYRADRFTLSKSAHGPLRPKAPQNPPTENGYYTLTVLADQKHVLPNIIVLNTHLRHGMANAVICAQKLQGILHEQWKSDPHAVAIIVGDMNHDRTTPVYAALVGKTYRRTHPQWVLQDTFDYAQKPARENWGTWHNFTGVSHHIWPTDLIFASAGWQVTPAKIIRDQFPGHRYPSDHFFVITTLTMPP